VSGFAPPLSFGVPFRRHICRSVIEQADGEEESKEIFEKGEEGDRKAEGHQEGGSHTAGRCSCRSTAGYQITL